MVIALNKFESQIEQVILDRGLNYYEKGKVVNWRIQTDDNIIFLVEGTVNYEVIIKMTDELIYEFSCNCLYKGGPVCKHVVAVIYYVNQEGSEVKRKLEKRKPLPIAPHFDFAKFNYTDFLSSPNDTGQGKQEADSVINSLDPKTAEQITHAIRELSYKELRQFLGAAANRDESIRNVLLINYQQKLNAESYKMYAGQIRDILDREKNDGYISFVGVRRLTPQLKGFCTDVNIKLDANNIHGAVYVLTALMDEMCKIWTMTQDPSEEFDDILLFTYNKLREISQLEALTKANEKDHYHWLKKNLFNWAISNFENRTLADSAYHVRMLLLAFLYKENDNDLELILSLTGAKLNYGEQPFALYVRKIVLERMGKGSRL